MQDLARLGSLLEPRGGVYRVACDERLAAPTTTSPMLIPMRTWSCSRSTAARISGAARAARRASSSCACGIPNTAIAASPMNFSTVPPCARGSSAARRGAPHRLLQQLGVDALAERRRADQIAEEHRDGL